MGVVKSLVDDNVTFAGPLAQLNGVEDYPSVPVANWLHVDGGRITSLRVAFDARERTP
jgi:hypothetical protein